MPALKSALLPVFALLAGACASPASAPAPERGPAPAVATDLSVAHAPFDAVDANWKHRLDQPYVYIERTGSYTEVGRLLSEVIAAMAVQGLEPSGPPFALYYDDPAQVPVEKLRARACFPVGTVVSPVAPLHYDVLPQTTVVYGFIGGAYPEVPRAYPGLYAFLEKMHWRENGPIREIYLVNPAEVQSFEELVTEVQIPATSAR